MEPRPVGTSSIPSTAFIAPATTTAFTIAATTAAHPPAVSEVEMRLSTSGGGDDGYVGEGYHAFEEAKVAIPAG